MDNKEFEPIIELKILDMVALIIDRNHLSFDEAIPYVYKSELYTLLTDETTKLWHLSTTKLYELLIDEKLNNKVNLPDYV